MALAGTVAVIVVLLFTVNVAGLSKEDRQSTFIAKYGDVPKNEKSWYLKPIDKNTMVGGWFVPHLPDLNLKNPWLAKYLIQNAIWCTEEFGIDGWIIRHNHALAPSLVASETQLPVINAGDGSHQHPTQAMLDAFTISRHIGDLVDKNILIVGDILHSRVARSEMDVLSLLAIQLYRY